MRSGGIAVGGIGIVSAVLLSACTHRLTVTSDLGIRGAPDWVNQGSNILATRGGRFFYGVGSAPPLGDASLQVDTADERARVEVARVLSTYLDAVSHDYLGATVAGGPAVGEAAVSRSLQAVTRLNLTGSKIIGRWRDPRTGIIYVLAQLDMMRVQQTLRGGREMHPAFSQYLTSQGNDIFDSRATTHTAR